MLTRQRIDELDQRVERARTLSLSYPASTEILDFYAVVAEFQRQIFQRLSPSTDAKSGTLTVRDQIDLVKAFAQLPSLLETIGRTGTASLKKQAADLQAQSSDASLAFFTDYIRGEEKGEGFAAFCARVCVQPLAEFAARNLEPPIGFAGSRCPLCNGRPQMAVLRPEGAGAKRFLFCSFCLTEWEFRRVLCPVCEETDHQKLPRFSTEDMPAIRVEGCDTCRYYLKSVDMTIDGRAVPVVDEIASAALDFWAADHNYKKICGNIMGF